HRGRRHACRAGVRWHPQRARQELWLAQSHQRGARDGERAREDPLAGGDSGEAWQESGRDHGLTRMNAAPAKELKVTLVKSLHGQLANIAASARGLDRK